MNKIKSEVPSKLPNPDFTKLIEVVESAMEHWGKTSYFFDESDTSHDALNKAITAIYGKEIWSWIDKRMFEGPYYDNQD